MGDEYELEAHKRKADEPEGGRELSSESASWAGEPDRREHQRRDADPNEQPDPQRRAYDEAHRGISACGTRCAEIMRTFLVLAAAHGKARSVTQG
jgi:hypothetical protein